MNQQRIPTASRPAWQQALANVVTSTAELLALCGLTPAEVPLLDVNWQDFPLRVPREFLSRIRPGDPHDPLLLQVLPSKHELLVTPGYTLDPLDEQQTNKLPGLLHKYHGRVLLTVIGACAINCRYCFRRHFPYQDNSPGREGWQRVVEYVTNDPSISEIIFSGGDPLVAKDNYLADLAAQFALIPHVKRLRIHTRMPIVIPQRINEELIEWLSASRLQTIVVVHCNHANEIDDDVRRGFRDLKNAGVTLLNQAVLLAGVNDTVTAQVALSEALFAGGCQPYYLHMLDKVHGSAHFHIAQPAALELMREVGNLLPGYMLPKLVKMMPGAASKAIVA
ncbi:MAG: EF-P beta-lysylation protein EpmB [Pseudomonadota bacterium]|nr:EF-P beta-lysylation protein EpmB [Pseudomonadota bacterium]